MKKLLIFIISVCLILTAFTACKKTNTNTEFVSEPALASGITTGTIRGDNYTNKSLGFKIVKPKGFDRLDAGDIVLDNEDVVLPDYYLLDNGYIGNINREFQIDIYNKYSSIDDWQTQIRKQIDKKQITDIKNKKSITIGDREYICLEYQYSNSQINKLLFATFDKGTTAVMTFTQFTYDDATQFISDNFKNK